MVASAETPRPRTSERLRDAVSGRSLAWALVVGAAVLAGLILRIWILTGPLGTVESDEAVVGLMAREALDGELHVFYWLNYYSGTQEVLLTALLFAVAGSSVLALKSVPPVLLGLACLVTWRIGRLTVGEPAARVGAALLWVWPPFLVFWSTKARPGYAFGLLAGAVVLWMALRLRSDRRPLDACALGFALGCGIWATPQSLLLSLPAVVWLLWRAPAVLRLTHWVLAGAVVGAAPWLAWNLTHGLKGVLPIESVQGANTTYAGRLADLFTIVLPEWLGVRLAYSKDWLLGAPVGVVLTLGALALLGFALLRRSERTEPLLLVLVLYPFVYAATSFTFFTDEPRYLVFIAPVPALLLATLLRRQVVAAAALAAAVLWSAYYLVRLEDQGRFRYLGQPDDMAPLIALLEREGESRAYGDYWIAYRLTFESDERIVATSTGFSRNAEYDRIVAADPSPAWVYVEGSAAERANRARLEGEGYERRTAGGWTAYVRP